MEETSPKIYMHYTEGVDRGREEGDRDGERDRKTVIMNLRKGEVHMKI